MTRELFTDYFNNSIKENWDLPSLQDYDNKDSVQTYGEFGNNILKLHKLFGDCGIKRGDKIVVVGKNSVNWGCVYLAAISYGAVIVPLLQDFTPKDIYNLTNHSDARLMFISNYILQKMDISNFELLEVIFKLDNFEMYYSKNEMQYTFDSKMAQVSQKDFELPTLPNDHIGVILYTSGTSGLPKGVMLKLNALAANIKYARANMPLVRGDKVVSFLPLAHCYGCAFDFLYPTTVGSHIIFLGKLPSPQVILKAFGEYKPRLILSVPLVIEKVYKGKIKPMLEKPTIKFLTKIPGLRTLIYNKINKTLTDSFGGNFIEVVMGGARVNREVETFLKKIKFRFTVGYGMTECGPLVAYNGWKTTKIFSTGILVDCLEARVDSREPGKVGEILLRGENVMSGYYKNPEETAKAIDKDGWLHTGDLGIIDNENYIFLKGRNKSMILTGSGQNVYPEEIESRFCSFPIVSECIVVSRSAQIVAMIYPDPDKTKGMNAEQIENELEICQKRINDEVPVYMRVSKIVVKSEEFEKTPKKSIKRYLYE